jgi:hypothetical protein
LGQAAGKKFFSATFLERKIMSTKTSFKRIALVAASALAIAGFSAVPSQAAANVGIVISGTGVTDAVASTATAGATANAVGDGSYYAKITLVAGTADKAYNITSSGVGSFVGVVGGTDAALTSFNNGVNISGGIGFFNDTSVYAAASAFGGAETIEFYVTSAAAGTQTVAITPTNATGAARTATITWGAKPVVSTQYSSSFISTVLTDSSTADVAGISVANTAASQKAVISVTLKSSSTSTLTGAGLTATITGPGTLGIRSDSAFPSAADAKYLTAATGRSITESAANSAGNAYYIVTVWGDGTSGASTITLTSGGVTVATETLTFTGSPKTATAVQNHKVLGAGKTTPGAGAGALTSSTDASTAATVATLPTIVANVVDSNGNGVAGTVKITSSDSTVIVTNGCTQVTTSATVVAGTYNCQVNGAVGAASGKTATVTFSVLNSTTGLYDIVAAPLTFTIGGALKTQSIATDSSTYTNLGPLKLVLTGKDSSGNAAYDQDVAFFGGAVTSSTQLGGAALPGATTEVALINGTATISGMYAPSISGDFTISGLDGVTGTTTLTTTANAAGDSTASLALDAANAATDAANNAYDEAQNATQAASDALAAVTALAKQVKSLIASVKKLTAAVAKLK